MLDEYLRVLSVDASWMYRVRSLAINWISWVGVMAVGWLCKGLICEFRVTMMAQWILRLGYSLCGDLHVLSVGFLHGFLPLS